MTAAVAITVVYGCLMNDDAFKVHAFHAFKEFKKIAKISDYETFRDFLL
jgi:hypothetical protein